MSSKWAAPLLLLAAGCASDWKQATAPLTGTVTYKGKPVVGANMSFFPDDAKLRPAVAVTDAAGKYVMETYEPKDGAAVGPGKLAITLRGPAKKGKAGLGEAATEGSEGDPLIPAKYFLPERSGLTFTVEKGKTNTFDIVLTD